MGDEWDILQEGLRCNVCVEQPAPRRLRMEITLRRTARDLKRILAGPLPEEERAAIEDDLQNVSRIIEELQHHRSHTPFFKVVARGTKRGEYWSIFDACTRYVVGTTSDVEAGDGCFVHMTMEDAERSVAAFPRLSRAWNAPRALLVVRGEGDVNFRHGKVAFSRITPVDELPWESPNVPRAAWRW